MFAVMSGIGGSSMVYILADFGVFDSLTSKGSGNLTVQEQEKRKLTGREKRFIKFASVEYNGQIYMTPQDFLDSVVEGEPRPRFKRKKLTESEVKNMMRKMPKLHRNNEKFFRGLGSKGIISFSEYLFLLTILIKPQSGFKIAFAMLDQDGNERVDKEEFKVLETVFSSAARERREQEKNQQNSENNNDDDEEKGNTEGEETSEEEANKKTHLDLDIFDDSDHGLTRSHNVDSSLLIYFFGRRGDAELCFEDFRKFMDNLQTEVLQMEYDEFAKGAQSITEVDFARILLRYTFLSSQEYKSILARLVDRLEDEAKNSKDGVLALKGITFQEFKDFCFFLNNLDDFQVNDSITKVFKFILFFIRILLFQIAMKMYTLADHAIKPEEFSRAATICSGKVLSPYVVKTVYQVGIPPKRYDRYSFGIGIGQHIGIGQYILVD